MAGWSQLIERVEAIPHPFQQPYRSLLAEAQPFPYLIFAPAIVGMRRKTNEKLLCLTQDMLCVWERLGKQIATAIYPLENISDLEIGQILLFSWLTIGGRNSDGEAKTVTVEFNTVSTPLYAPVVARVRPQATHNSQAQWQAELAKFNYLEKISYKFMNYARESVTRGEKIITTIWQPKISNPLLTLFGRPFYPPGRAPMPAHLTILTDREVIFIGDDRRLMETKGGRYGGIWHYVLLPHVSSASVEQREAGLWALRLNLLAGNRQVERLYSADNQAKLLAFRDALMRFLSSPRS